MCVPFGHTVARTMWVIPRQITQSPTRPPSDVSEKITENTSMCSNDRNKILDPGHY